MGIIEKIAWFVASLLSRWAIRARLFANKIAWCNNLCAPLHTYEWDECPEGYEGPCACESCRDYARADFI